MEIRVCSMSRVSVSSSTIKTLPTGVMRDLRTVKPRCWFELFDPMNVAVVERANRSASGRMTM
jgi:hypothetical protein